MVALLLQNKPIQIQWEKFSSWTLLVHTICYILRWKSLNQLEGPISLDEYQNSGANDIQKDASPTEYAAWTEKKESLSESNIVHLCPFIDDNDFIRARG